ncbi:MAG: hypothetical protein Q7R56_03480 [Nanoarchaeota archaeon]|nr:hypothetical protein [Nanoarchaeota archaeon]
MNGTCCGSSCEPERNFLTKEEKIEMLKDYQQTLEKEAQGVKERIKDMERNN